MPLEPWRRRRTPPPSGPSPPARGGSPLGRGRDRRGSPPEAGASQTSIEAVAYRRARKLPSACPRSDPLPPMEKLSGRGSESGPPIHPPLAAARACQPPWRGHPTSAIPFSAVRTPSPDSNEGDRVRRPRRIAASSRTPRVPASDRSSYPSPRSVAVCRAFAGDGPESIVRVSITPARVRMPPGSSASSRICARSAVQVVSSTCWAR